jgi:hypothetical protein
VTIAVAGGVGFGVAYSLDGAKHNNFDPTTVTLIEEIVSPTIDMLSISRLLGKRRVSEMLCCDGLVQAGDYPEFTGIAQDDSSV